MTERTKNILAIVIPGAVAIAFLLLWLTGTATLPGTKGSYRIKALVPQSASITKATNVMVAGLPVGRVESVDRKGTGAVLELSIEDEHAPIPRDSRVSVRLRTLVGENYLEIYPGKSSSHLSENEVLPMSQADEYVEADEILDTLQGKTRQRAREMMQGLGGGVGDRGQKLNRLLGGVAGVIEGAAPVTRVLDQDRRRLARMIDDLGEVSRAIGERGESLRALTSGARVSFQAIANRDEAVRELLDQMPGTLSQVRSTTATVRSVTREATPVLFNLAAAVREAKPAVRLLRPAAQEGRRVVSELGRAARPLQGTLRRLRTLSPPTVKALPRVGEVFCEVNPALKYLRPYDQDVSTLLNNLGSVTNFYDANGHAARIYITIGSGGMKSFDAETSKAVDTLIDSGVLGRQNGFGYNPYPAARNAGDLKTGLGARGPDQVRAPYKRIKAEC